MIEIGQGQVGPTLAMESEKAPLRNDVRVGTGTMGRSQPHQYLKGEHSRTSGKAPKQEHTWLIEEQKETGVTGI